MCQSWTQLPPPQLCQADESFEKTKKKQTEKLAFVTKPKSQLKKSWGANRWHACSHFSKLEPCFKPYICWLPFLKKEYLFACKLVTWTNQTSAFTFLPSPWEIFLFLRFTVLVKIKPFKVISLYTYFPQGQKTYWSFVLKKTGSEQVVQKQ